MNKYLFFCFILLFTSSSPCCKDQFAALYFSCSLIVLVQVYNCEIRHHSLVCCCGFADILNILQDDRHIRLFDTWQPPSLRTADVFPVVASLPPIFGGREATTGNASTVRRLGAPQQEGQNSSFRLLSIIQLY